ncbi:DUF751 family protein [Acaryochloris sp. 'Moss Beach']|uniref:DUF751 family protein n=1 Tax=Acaryochloris TaxID=155977 RepID=UPI001BAEAAD6|nr:MULTISPECIES: DUF751 family protein [Acaryochloris]QUY42591.1 DUF751 family protein [Acaryochloris marina S15]UJB71673.1 DUF751 family protein [Acaryochloris sp. 'Moss Beach']
MGDFFKKLSSYPKLFLAIVVGVFWTFIKPLQGFTKNPVTGIAALGIIVGGFAFLSFTLSAMMGLTPLN